MATTAAEAGDTIVRAEWDQQMHPWRRYGARTIDITVFSLLFDFVAAFFGAFAWPALLQFLISPPLWANFVLLIPSGVALAGVAVALCHARWGSTPGKWIFRLRVRNADGGRLSLRQALLREINLFWWGFGLALPLLSLLMLAQSYNDLENDGVTRWDRWVKAQSSARVIKGAAYAWLVLGAIIAIAAKSFGIIALMMDIAK